MVIYHPSNSSHAGSASNSPVPNGESIKASVKVYVRIRPYLDSELEECNGSPVVLEANDTIVNVHDIDAVKNLEQRSFSFDRCFWSVPRDQQESQCAVATQETIFDECGAACIESAIQGYNVCLMAYGQTTSGKTYTMLGTPKEPGLVKRCCQAIFESRVESVALSVFEVYADKVYDLLPTSAKPDALRVRQHPTLGTYVEGLTTIDKLRFEDCMELIALGGSSRRTASTDVNERSSRSHAVFQIKITSVEKRTGATTKSIMNFVDLAGSERRRDNMDNSMMQDTTQINLSLTTLRKVISALHEASKDVFGSKHIIPPYRESTLTWLLSECMGGNSLTSMLATVSPSRRNIKETLSTLRYAMKAKSLVNRVKQNYSSDDMIKTLKFEVDGLKEHVRRLENRELFYGDITGGDKLREEFRKLQFELQNEKSQRIQAVMDAEAAIMQSRELKREIAEVGKSCKCYHSEDASADMSLPAALQVLHRLKEKALQQGDRQATLSQVHEHLIKSKERCEELEDKITGLSRDLEHSTRASELMVEQVHAAMKVGRSKAKNNEIEFRFSRSKSQPSPDRRDVEVPRVEETKKRPEAERLISHIIEVGRCSPNHTIEVGRPSPLTVQQLDTPPSCSNSPKHFDTPPSSTTKRTASPSSGVTFMEGERSSPVRVTVREGSPRKTTRTPDQFHGNSDSSANRNYRHSVSIGDDNHTLRFFSNNVSDRVRRNVASTINGGSRRLTGLAPTLADVIDNSSSSTVVYAGKNQVFQVRGSESRIRRIPSVTEINRLTHRLF